MKPTSSLRSVRACQRGAATIIVAMLLTLIMVAAVLGMLIMAGSSVMDAGNNSQQISALFLAESGLERGQATIFSAYPITDSVCTGIAGGPYALGSGSFTLSGVSTPPSCDNTTATPCLKCLVTATGIVGADTRTISRTLSLTTVDGTFCNTATAVPDCTNATAPPPTWDMVLKNTYSNNAIALFNLANRRQGNWSGASCSSAVPSQHCALMWEADAQNGSKSVGDMGNAVTIPAAQTYTIYQQLNGNYNLAEVGALFPGSGANGPSIVGSTAPSIANARAYWDDTNPAGGGSKTVGKSGDSQGQTNNGTANTVTSCIAPASNSKQSCDNWCLAGDTLVFGFAAHSDSGTTDSLTGVSFNTAGAPAQNISLTRIAKFPTSTIPGAPNDVYSEVWYAHNPDYLSNLTAASSGGVVTGSIGTYTASMSNNSNVMTTVPAEALHIGDTVACAGGQCPAFLPATITATTGGTSPYKLSANCVNPHCNSFSGKTASANLDVAAFTSGYLSVGDTITGTGVIAGTTITSIVGAGNVPGSYGISLAQTVASTGITANGQTIHVSGGTVPATGIPAAGTIVAVKSVVATGAFAADTTVLAAPVPTATLYKVSAVPSTRLSGATVCGGTCAFFDQTAATTTFTIGKTSATNYWASGFMCLTGADITPIPVTSSTIQATNWYEAVR